MEYTYCRECGARAEKDNPQCPFCGSSDIGQKYSEMTLEEKKRALKMMDYKKCPKCGKIIHKLEWPCGGCIDNKTQRLLVPIFDADQKIKNKLPKWMLEKPAEHYFCSGCFARMEENASSCPECGEALGCKKFSEMTDEEKKLAYKYAKENKKSGILAFISSILVPVGLIILFCLAFSISLNFKKLVQRESLELVTIIAPFMCLISYCYLLAVYDFQKKKGFFEKAKGVKKVSIIGYILLQIIYVYLLIEPLL